MRILACATRQKPYVEKVYRRKEGLGIFPRNFSSKFNVEIYMCALVIRRQAEEDCPSSYRTVSRRLQYIRDHPFIGGIPNFLSGSVQIPQVATQTVGSTTSLPVIATGSTGRTSGRTALPTEFFCPTGFLCGRAIGLELIARVDPAVGKDGFRKQLKTFPFATY